ncbi:FAD-binding oxidoreductase [Prochlorococcus sp. AH-716-A09]|nr:FAD-binding oxidoreductase [Prochlorococcus sp. AH-716-A09]
MDNFKKRFSLISGWGLNKWAKVNIFTPKNFNELVYFIKRSTSSSILVRGLGRSYGDAANLDGQNVINLENFKKIKLNSPNSTLTAGGGATLREIIKEIVPKGFFLPVVPGTSNITIGGAVASDVHGKNHYQDGSFGDHILKISLIDGNGNLQDLSPLIENQKEKFWATVGGMGLTGVIYEVTINLISISSSLISK